jgi:hypothetical protein
MVTVIQQNKCRCSYKNRLLFNNVSIKSCLASDSGSGTLVRYTRRRCFVVAIYWIQSTGSSPGSFSKCMLLKQQKVCGIEFLEAARLTIKVLWDVKLFRWISGSDVSKDRFHYSWRWRLHIIRNVCNHSPNDKSLWREKPESSAKFLFLFHIHLLYPYFLFISISIIYTHFSLLSWTHSTSSGA